MGTIEDPVLGSCTVIPLRPSTVIWPLAFIAMGIAGPCILVAWLFNLADLGDRLIVVGFLGTFMTPMIPASVKNLNLPYYAKVGPNGFATPSSGPIMWSDVSDVGFYCYRGKPLRFNLKLSRPRPLSFTTRMGNYFGLIERDAATKISLPLKGSTLPKDELFALFAEHIVAAKDAEPGSVIPA